MQLCTQKYITSRQRGVHLQPPYPPLNPPLTSLPGCLKFPSSQIFAGYSGYSVWQYAKTGASKASEWGARKGVEMWLFIMAHVWWYIAWLTYFLLHHAVVCTPFSLVEGTLLWLNSSTTWLYRNSCTWNIPISSSCETYHHQYTCT